MGRTIQVGLHVSTRQPSLAPWFKVERRVFFRMTELGVPRILPCTPPSRRGTVARWRLLARVGNELHQAGAPSVWRFLRRTPTHHPYSPGAAVE